VKNNCPNASPIDKPSRLCSALEKSVDIINSGVRSQNSGDRILKCRGQSINPKH
jgi:hypothetical protein